MRRLLLVAVVALSAVLVPRADAASPVPAPTVSITYTSQAGTSPYKGAKATWKVGKPGKFGELFVESTNLPGTTTTIQGLWTSADVRIFKGIVAASSSGEFLRRGAPTGTASAYTGIRFRIAGKAWSPWRDTEWGLPFYNNDNFVVGESLKPGRNEPVRYQFQLRFKVVISDTNKETQHWTFRANN